MTPRARLVCTSPGAPPADLRARIDHWADLMAARGHRVNLLRLWRMQATMPALTLLTGLALPHRGAPPGLHLAGGR